MTSYQSIIDDALKSLLADPSAAVARLDALCFEARRLGHRGRLISGLRALSVALRLVDDVERLTAARTELDCLLPPSPGLWTFDPNDPLLPLKGRFIDIVRDTREPKDFVREMALLRRRARSARCAELASLCLQGMVSKSIDMGDARRASRYARQLVIEAPLARNVLLLAESQFISGDSDAAWQSVNLALKLSVLEDDSETEDKARTRLSSKSGG